MTYNQVINIPCLNRSFLWYFLLIDYNFFCDQTCWVMQSCEAKAKKNLKSVVWHFLIGFHIYAFNAFGSLSFLYITIYIFNGHENFTVTLL